MYGRPQIARPNNAWFLEAEKREMLLACLKGGMSYEDAKEACAKEYDEKIRIANESYRRSLEARVEAQKDLRNANVSENPISDLYTGKSRFWPFW